MGNGCGGDGCCGGGQSDSGAGAGGGPIGAGDGDGDSGGMSNIKHHKYQTDRARELKF